MIRSISWVPQRTSKPFPCLADPPSNEEIEEAPKKNGVLERLEENESEEEDENMVAENSKQDDLFARALAAAANFRNNSKGSTWEADNLIDDSEEEFDMHIYDEEEIFDKHIYDEEEEEAHKSGKLILLYNEEVDKHINTYETDDSDSEEEDGTVIKTDDFKIIIAQTEDDISHLEAWILEYEPTSKEYSLYLDHDIIIPAVPLCTAWLDCPIKGGEKGNFIAVGSMEPAIEIWDLDIGIIDEVQPSAVLGGIKYKDGSHTDSVLGLAWNKEYRNILASASADKLVKVWDVATETCTITMENHTDKVEAVAWNNFAPQVLLSGSFDHTIVMKDGRIPTHSGFKWAVDADVKCLAWDPHTEHSFVVSLENGRVSGFDIRAASSNLSSDPKLSFTIHAHNKSVSSISYNPAVPNLLATGSMDKLVKLWDLSNQPSCVATHKPKAGALFSISFSEDSPFVLAVGGSKGKMEVWDLLTDDAITSIYGKYSRKAKPPPS